eukprot:Blabericola_migrator_1__10355@NODE_582_length_7491_cov_233_955684_g431_i0_p2_GENE_NODE_582_length_7491_cov_233_955684_g431_i0NODE_582_length_7491_cov_233_955684_g431_i0_p2_ORF_typecomplete_len813_score163_46G6PD_C/PF02781_16/3e116G6PD_N/PF00479_22/4_2e54Glucosamine_iso/PF01182_20/4_6e03Glucosamine_iso/PF01182_20/8_3e43_NODE_582_length_7491_cov_233_955684_g431_i0332441
MKTPNLAGGSSPLGMSRMAARTISSRARDSVPARHEVLLPPSVINCYNESAFVSSAATVLINSIRHSIAVDHDDGTVTWSGGWAIIGLSGGSTPVPVYQMVNQYMRSEAGQLLDWDKVIWFLVDERYVPADSDLSNAKMIKGTLFKDTTIPLDNILLPDTSLPIETCVEEYEAQLAEVFQYSRPTLVVLGLGPDGHLASWFPPMSHEESFTAYDPFHLVAQTKQDRFPAENRITVTMHVITGAKRKCFFIKGGDKISLYKKLVEQTPTKELVRQQPLLQILRSEDVTIVASPPLDRDAVTELHTTWKSACKCLTIVVLGASGDLAMKKTFPALFSLMCSQNLPEDFHIAAYARSELTPDQLLDKMRPKLTSLADHFALRNSDEAEKLIEAFRSKLSVHRCGAYGSAEDSKTLSKALHETFEKNFKIANRLFYLALPPDQFASAVSALKASAWSPTGWTRLVVEKPFGRDTESSEQLSAELAKYAKEEEIFRIDHYLGKEMVLNLIILRFANVFLTPLWSRSYIQAVRITFKETLGTEGRGGYFERYGIIRDVIQNHLLQILSLIAMERPVTLNDEDIRDEKVKVLRCASPVKFEETVIGQYTASSDGHMRAYRDDKGVPSDSICPTFATCVLRVNNERWSGVPFILKAGKALEKTSTEIRLQMKPVCVNLFEEHLANNELVIRIQPEDAIYLKVMGKKPGLHEGLVESELDLSVLERLQIDRVNDAYERLLLDVVKGDKRNFVRSDELREAWRIFTPLLNELESRKTVPEFYEAGSTGPEKAYALIRNHGYTKNEGYTWVKI